MTGTNLAADPTSRAARAGVGAAAARPSSLVVDDAVGEPGGLLGIVGRLRAGRRPSTATLAMIPFLAFVGIFLIWPMAAVVVKTFTPDGRFGVATLVRAVTGPYQSAFTNSLMLAGASAVIGGVLGLAAGAAVLKLATEIAQMHPHALLMAKRTINQALDAQGQHNALQNAFEIHSLGHANAWIVSGYPVMVGLDEMTRGNREKG